MKVWWLSSRMQRWADWAPNGWRRSVGLLALDSAIISLSYYTAYALRFDSHIPPDRLTSMVPSYGAASVFKRRVGS